MTGSLPISPGPEAQQCCKDDTQSIHLLSASIAMHALPCTVFMLLALWLSSRMTLYARGCPKSAAEVCRNAHPPGCATEVALLLQCCLDTCATKTLLQGLGAKQASHNI